MKAVHIDPLLTWLLTTDQQKQCLELLQEQCSFEEMPQHIVVNWDLIFKDKSAEMKTKCALLFEAMKTLPIATLTLAFHPTYAQLREYATLLRAHLDEHLIVELNVEENIVAGCKVSFNGQQFSSTLEETLKNNC